MDIALSLTSPATTKQRQSLPLTMQLPKDSVIVLDALRKQRNLNDYEGDPIANSASAACLSEAENLLAHTRQWLTINHFELIECT